MKLSSTDNQTDKLSNESSEMRREDRPINSTDTFSNAETVINDMNINIEERLLTIMNHRINEGIINSEESKEAIFFRLESMIRDTPILRFHTQLILDIDEIISLFNNDEINHEQTTFRLHLSTIKYSGRIDKHIQQIFKGKDPHNLDQHFVGENEMYDPRWPLTHHNRSIYMNTPHYKALQKLANTIAYSKSRQEEIELLLPGSRVSKKFIKDKEFEFCGIKVFNESMKEMMTNIIQNSVLFKNYSSDEQHGTTPHVRNRTK